MVQSSSYCNTWNECTVVSVVWYYENVTPKCYLWRILKNCTALAKHKVGPSKQISLWLSVGLCCAELFVYLSVQFRERERERERGGTSGPDADVDAFGHSFAGHDEFILFLFARLALLWMQIAPRFRQKNFSPREKGKGRRKRAGQDFILAGRVITISLGCKSLKRHIEATVCSSSNLF